MYIYICICKSKFSCSVPEIVGKNALQTAIYQQHLWSLTTSPVIHHIAFNWSPPNK